MTRAPVTQDHLLPPEDLLDYLTILRTDRVPHSGRTLRDHLLGTWQILRQWDCEEVVCNAGLFHSIYGTNAFGFGRLSRDDRSLVTRMIGAQAEQLVYLFCVSHRPDAFLEALGTGSLYHREQGVPLPASRETCAALIEIECANLIEQGSGDTFLRRLATCLDAAPSVPLPVGLRTLLGVKDAPRGLSAAGEWLPEAAQ